MDFIDLNHLKDVNETWGEHWSSTMKYGFMLLGLFFICIIHAFIPFICTKVVTRTIIKIQNDILCRKYADEPEYVKYLKNNVRKIK